MNDAAQIVWPIGPLPVAITCLSLFFLTRLLLNPAAFNEQYVWFAFGIAPSLVAVTFFLAGVRGQSDVTPLIQVLATLITVGLSFFLFAAIRRTGGLEIFGQHGNDPLPLIILVGGWVLYLGFFVALIAFFHVVFENRELWECNRSCRSLSFWVGSRTSAFAILWLYTIIIGTFGTLLVIVTVQLVRRLSSGSRSWWV